MRQSNGVGSFHAVARRRSFPFCSFEKGQVAGVGRCGCSTVPDSHRDRVMMQLRRVGVADITKLFYGGQAPYSHIYSVLSTCTTDSTCLSSRTSCQPLPPFAVLNAV